MELVALFRMLWRFRAAVVVGGLLSLMLGFMAVRGTPSRLGVASLRVAVDTPSSETVAADPPGASSLAWRAALSADLMATATIRQRIAKQMNVDSEKLAVTAPSLSIPMVPTPLPVAASKAAGTVAEPYQLAIQSVSDLPIVEIDARAPTRATAAMLARVASDELKAEFAVTGTHGTEKFVVNSVGPVRSRAIVSGPRKVMAVAIAFVVFTLWCLAITLVAALAGRRNQRAWPAVIRRPRTGIP